MSFKAALLKENPLQIVGTINAYTAILAKSVGYRAIYLSGAGVANASLGIPDLGVTTLHDVLEDAMRITDAVDIPLLVDIDTGFGGAFSIARTIKSLIKAGVAAVHLEDQVQAKRCGHRPGKALVNCSEMVDRIKAAVDARTNSEFVIIARTDALAVEGMQACIARAEQYVAAGADIIFFEAANSLEDYARFILHCQVPVLANMTEFGVTPLFGLDQLASVGVQLVLYPLSAFRAMSKAALMLYQTIRQDGSQRGLIDHMQTRKELYYYLNYHAYEDKLNSLFAKDGHHE